MKRLFLPLIAATLIIAGVIADHIVSISLNQPSPAVAQTSASSSASPGVPASAIDQATERAYSLASASVVYVESVGTGTGSGVIYDSNGDIVTNDHVVDGATKLNVTLSDGRKFSATLVGTDKADDLAIIRIHASGLRPARFASAGTYHVAQTVLAIGSPLGLKQSVTSGLISGIHRVEQEPNGAYLANAVQTSAAINPGNSGGALVTLSGVVVGIPTLEQTSTTEGSAAQNIGFAIPSERVTLIANQIISSGKVEHTGRAYLGVAPTDSSGSSGSFGFGPNQNTPSTPGAVVARVASNGPAAKAGVQQGDVVTSAGGASITSAQDLLTVLTGKKPGDTLTLQLNRNGSTMTVKVHLGELPA